MKNIFVGGVAKSGKSRFASKLCDGVKINHIPIDYFASSFKHNFKEVGITSDVVINKRSSELLSLFLSRFIEIVESNSEEYFILDSAHVMPSDIVKYLDLNKWDVYFLGYPEITSIEKLKEVREHVHDGWVLKRDDIELVEIFDELIELSKVIRDECEMYDIKFLDTSSRDVYDLIVN